MKRLLCFVFCLLLTRSAFSQSGQVLPIHQPIDPALVAALAQPIPLTATIPTVWTASTCPLSYQAHWSRADLTMQHTHIEWPCELAQRDINGPVTTAFRLVQFQEAGTIVFDPPIYSDLIVPGSIIWDETGSTTVPDLAGDPTPGVATFHTGHLTIDPNRLVAASDGQVQGGTYPAALHGWFRFQTKVRTQFDDGSVTDNMSYVPLYSTIDQTQPETNLYPAIDFREENNIGGDGGFWGEHIFDCHGSMLPTFGTLIVPYTANCSGYIYAGGPIVELIPNGAADWRVDEDLHHSVPGTILTSVTQTNFCCFSIFPVTFDPSVVSNGFHKWTGNWNFMGGPAADFPDSRMMGALFTIGVTSSTTAPPPPPPPLPLVLTMPVLMQPVTTGGTPPVSVNCVPVAGTALPPGSTMLSCTATDSGSPAQSVSGTETVTVSVP